MARKKKQTYNDMVRMMGNMQEKIIGEKDRMAGVLASELDYDAALQLGDLSDTELRRVAAFIFSHIGMLADLAKLGMPKAQQLPAAEDGPMAEGELKYNFTEHCWDIWDTDTDKPVGKLRPGMRVELQDPSSEEWEPVEAGVTVMDLWRLMKMNRSDSDSFDRSLEVFSGLRVRFHKA